MVNKVWIIFWKDMLMRKNHYIATSFEVLLPIALILIANIALPKYEHEIDNNPLYFEEYKDNACAVKHGHYGSLVYEPSTPFTNKLMSKAGCYAGYLKSNVKPGYLNFNGTKYSIGIKFENLNINESSIPESLNYTLYPTNKVWNNLLTLWRSLGSAIPRYNIPSLHNVAELQRAIDISFMHMKNISAKKLNIENTDVFGRSSKVFYIAIYVSLFMAFSLMIPPIISRIVQEKYTGAKELMLMMGVQRWQLWCAKFMDVILFASIAVGGMLIFLYVPLKSDSNVLKISPFVFWSVIMYGLIGVILFLFFLSCFFKKATFAVYVSSIIWCFSFVFNNFISSVIELPHFVKYVFCLLPSVTVMNGVLVLLDFDFYDKNIRLTEKLSWKEDYLSLLNVLLMMTLNIFLYALLTWYLEQVKPGKFGVPLPYNFCFTKSYWRPCKVNSASYNKYSGEKIPENFESVPNNLEVGVSLQNVSKIYKSLDKGSVTAVDNVSLNFYKCEISALLGHNGAGKTTVFSIITGLTYPSSGKVYINGYDLGINVREARRSLGLCPQHDMLFNNLTTEQTLKFYGIIKGLSFKKAKEESFELLKKLKLEKVKNVQACNLSGGQRRKVSLAIALIGGSEVLVLDEPTSGMDPEIRREIWEILLEFRGTRTILLTTHFMEEADALCDRIAIMDHGQVKCYGSTMFLKSKFGKGYVLSVVVFDQEKSSKVTNYITSLIPTAKLKSQNIRTLTYELPESEVDAFPDLLSGLDQKQTNKEITSYGISLAPLEDVFLRLRKEASTIEPFDIEVRFRSPSLRLYPYQFWVLLIKKWILFTRCYKSFIVYSLLPAIIIFLIIYTSYTKHPLSESKFLKQMTFSTNLYSPFLVLYSEHNQEVSSAFEKFIKSLHCDVEKVSNIKDAVKEIYKQDFYIYAKMLNLGVEFSPEEIRLFHNEEAVHMVPVAINTIHNFILRMSNVSGSIHTSVNIKYANEDFFIFPTTPKCNIEELPDFSGTQTLFYLIGPTKENFFGAKEIQLMMTPPVLYWISSLLFDVISFAVYILLIAVGVGVSENDEFMLQHSSEIFVSLILWGVGLILFAYFISTIVKNIAAAFSVNLILYFIFSFVIYNIISFGSLPSYFQYLHPSCIIKFGYVDLCAGKKNNYKMALVLYDLALFILLCLKDSGFLSLVFHRMINKCIKVDYSLRDEKDEFVIKEEEAVKKMVGIKNTSGAVLIVDQLKKWYSKRLRATPAVRGVSFAVKQGECFGLLGVNGAGKTSTFKMLIGALPPSHGSTYVCSTKLSFLNRHKYLFSIGYCPQFGGLIPVFKGREVLHFFARLRGLSSSRATEEVRKWLEKFDLFEFANRKCGTYSGGNQRKLSSAISLVGDCPLIFLDEPTSGVDPVSRRSIWNVIGGIQKAGQSVVLTSHSMDECEALCSRLAIMVNGRFRCIGETTTLKDRFGQGYCIQLKIVCGISEEDLKNFKSAISESFNPGCELIDEHLTILQYHVKNKSMTWAEVFLKLKSLKQNFEILESYTASATTLEQIFIYFARNQ